MYDGKYIIFMGEGMVLGYMSVDSDLVVDCGFTDDLDEAIMFELPEAYKLMAFLNEVADETIFVVCKAGDYLDLFEEGGAGSMREDDRS